ncbi:MAG: T9SS type A sorting domain-containing protein [Melioribacteraceae bacterium]|nr:T9SS type A sorting domain-containing protein [Melioribacteraceae bacterium]
MKFLVYCFLSFLLFVTNISGQNIPTLLQPPNGFTEVPAQNAFFNCSWVNNASMYRLWISSDQNFNTIDYQKEQTWPDFSNISLTEGNTYFWKVQTKVNDVWESWSSPFSFTVHTINIVTPSYKFSVIDYQENSIPTKTFRGELVGDTKGDGIKRLLSGNGRAGKLEIYQYINNTLVLEHEIPILNSPSENASIVPKIIGDIDNDGNIEFIVAAENYSTIPTPTFFGIYRWNGLNYVKVFEKQEQNFAVNQNNSVIFTDLNNDGNNELVMVVNNLIGVYNFQNNTLNKISEYPQFVQARISVGDTDGDGLKEIVTHFNSQNGSIIRILGFDGSNFNLKADINGFINPLGGVLVEDLNNDGKGEIVTGTGWIRSYELYMNIIGFDGNGYSIIKSDRTQFGVGQFLVGDLDGDGNNEVVMFNNANGSYVYDYENGNYLLGFINHTGAVENGEVADLDNDNSAEVIAASYGALQILSIYSQSPKVVLLNPSNHVGNVNPMPTFTWEAYAGAASYTLEITTMSDFVNPAFRFTNITGTSYTMTESLRENFGTYNWRVKADKSQWSDVWNFGTGSNIIPRLLEPQDGYAFVPAMNAFLSWKWVSGASKYQFQISYDENFLSIYLDEETNQNTKWNISFSEGNTYYWRVRSYVNNSWSEWSASWRFSVNTRNLTLPDYKFSSVDFSLPREQGGPFSSALAGNINNDGITRLLVGSQETGMLQVYRNLNGAYIKEWERQLISEAELQQTPYASIVPNMIGDVDNDGRNEIIVGFEGIDKIEMYRWNGNTYERIFQGAQTGHMSNRIGSIVDLDNDGQNEVVMAMPFVGVYKYTGNLFQQIWNSNEMTVQQIAVGDADNDGKFELVYPVMDDERPSLSIVDVNGGVYTKHSSVTGFDHALGGVVIEDLDGNSSNEIYTGITQRAASYQYFIHKIEFNGTSYQNTSTYETPWGLFNAKVGDLDSDGKNEIGFFGNVDGLTVLDYENNSLLIGRVRHHGSVRYGELSDTDNDGAAEIIAPNYAALDFVSVFSQSPKVALLSPSNHIGNVNPMTTFTWEAFAGALSYTLEITTMGDFTNPAFRFTNITGTSYTMTESLRENFGTYNWRVKADNSQWSDVWNFGTGSNPIPRLLEPRNGFAEVPAQNAFLRWNWVNGATSFRVELSEDQNFSTLVTFQENNNTQLWNLNLTEGKTYYWRAKALLNGVWGEWSSTWSFTVHTINIATQPYKYASVDYTKFGDATTSFRGALVGDVKGDGLKRIAIGNGKGGKLEIHRYENGELVKEIEIPIISNTADWTSIVPKAIADIDNDGKNEILVVGEGSSTWDPSVTQIYKWDGSSYQKIFEKTNFIYQHSAVMVTDVDKDGKNELLMSGGNLRIIKYDSGTNIFTDIWQYNDGPDNGNFAVDDVDGDGYNEIVFGSRQYPEWESKKLIVLGYNGSSYQLESEVGGFTYSLGGVSIVDLNNDGKKEIIAGTGSVQCYTYNLYKIEHQSGGYSITNTDRVGFGVATSKVGDIDGDGNNEVVMARTSYGSYIYYYLNGQYKSGLVEHTSSWNGDVANIDSDVAAEIIVPEQNRFEVVSIFNQSPKVALLSPSNHIGNVNPMTTFTWEAYSGALSYTLEITTMSDFVNPAFRFTNITGTSYTMTESLRENFGTYNWRVKADNSQWSDVWNFGTGSNPIPRLLEPRNGFAEVPAQNAFLRWNWVNGATSFRVELSEDQNFSTLVTFQENNNTQLWNLNLTEGKTYYWRAKALLNGVWGEWSSTWSFTVHTINIDTPAYKFSSVDYTKQGDATSSFRGVLSGNVKNDGINRILIGNGRAGKLEISRYENGNLINEDEITVITNPVDWSNLSPKAIADIDKDGKNEIIVIGEGFSSPQPNLFKIYRSESGSYTQIFERQDNTFNVNANSSFETADLDKDGNIELIMVVNGLVGVYQYSSNTLNKIWEFPQPTDSKFALGDTDGDGYLEIITTQQSYPEWESKSVYILGYDGSTYRQEGMLSGFVPTLGGITIEDFNNDGKGEIFVGTGSYQVYTYNNYVIGFDNGAYSILRSDRVQYGTLKGRTGDIDGDGKNEIVLFRAANGSYIYDYENGQLNLGYIDHSGYAENGEVANVDSDLAAEILAPAFSQFNIVSIYDHSPKVVLITPSQGQNQISPTAQFSWQQYEGAVSYTLQINNNPDLTNPLYSYLTNSTTFTVPQALNENSGYWWRVKADNSQWSDVWNFYTSSNPIPRLIEPRNGYAEVQIWGILYCSIVSQASTYYFEYSQDPNFSPSLTLSKESISNIEYFNFEDGKTYYWRTRAKIQDMWGDWSEVWSFTVHQENRPVYKISNVDASANIQLARSVLAGDFRGDGQNRIYIGTSDGKIVEFEYQNGQYVNIRTQQILLENEYKLGDGGYGDLIITLIEDIDKDGKNEMLVDVERTNKFLILKWDGSKHVRWLEQSNNSIHYKPMSFVDINKDGINELVVGGNQITIYNYSSTLNSLVTLQTINQSTGLQIAVGDIDNDYSLEIISPSSPWAQSNHGILIIGYDGTQYVVENNITGFSHALNGCAVADLDENGLNEIYSGVYNVATYDYYFYKIEKSTNDFIISNLFNARAGIFGVHSGDVDGDSKNEIVFNKNGATSVLDFENNQYIWGNIANSGVFCHVMDTDNDGVAEMLSPHQNIVISIKSELAKIILVSPSNNQTGVNQLATFTWQPLSNATRYFVQISNTPDFFNPMFMDSTDTPTYTKALPNNSVHYWRVKSNNSQWSDIWKFNTIGNSKPILLSPENGFAQVPSHSANLKWYGVNGATKYRVEVALDPSFTNVILFQENANAAYWDVPVNEGSTYFWRVKSYTNNMWSEWSDIWNFTVCTQIGVTQQWLNQGAFPSEDVSWKSQNHAIAVDPDGKIWIGKWQNITGFINPATGKALRAPVYLTYVFNPDGTQASFSPLFQVMGDTMYTISQRGMRTNIDGNILLSTGPGSNPAALYMIDYKTGYGLKKVTFPGTPTAASVSSDGTIFIAPVTEGTFPLSMYDQNLNLIGTAIDRTKGFSRSFEVSKDGNTIYWAGYTNGKVHIYKRNDASSNFALVDSILSGFHAESFTWHPVTGHLWISAGSQNDKPTNGYTPGTWYAYDTVTKMIVDSLKWNFSNPTLPNERPRALAFSNDGKIAYAGQFGVGSAPMVQRFVKGIVGPFSIELATNPANGGITTGDGAYYSGNTITINVIPNSGYSFVNWMEDGNIVSTNKTFTFTANKSRAIVANLIQQTPIQVTYSCDMQYEIASGRFNPLTDYVELRGTEFGWEIGIRMTQDPNQPNLFTHTAIQNVQSSGENLPDYKFWYTSVQFGDFWENGNNRTHNVTPEEFNNRSISINRTFDDIRKENSTNRVTSILIQVNLNGGKDVFGNALPSQINNVHLTGSSVPLSWAGWFIQSSDFMTPMYDDGTHGDLVANDKVYSNLISFPIYTKFQVELAYVINYDMTQPQNIVYENNGGDNHIFMLEHDLVKAKIKNVYGFMSNYGEIITPLYDKEYINTVEQDLAKKAYVELINNTSGKLQKDIQKSYDFFLKSLDPKLWIDESHLTANGQQMFEASKNAVKDLMKLDKEPIYSSKILPLIIHIFNADKYVVELYYSELITKYEALGCGATPTNSNCTKWKRDLDDAQKLIAEVYSDYSKENYDKAIITLKQAWLNLKKIQGAGLAKEMGELLNEIEIPTDYYLSQNYPNPFNPSTQIQFGLPSDSKVQINVYNILGERVHTIADQFYSAGIQTLHFNAADLSNGVYIYSITAISNEGKIFRDTKKMLLVK